MSTVSTTEAGMRAAAQEFEAKSGEFRTSNESVAGRVEDLTIFWKGQASQGFRTAMEQWGQSFNQVISALDELRGQLQGASATYLAAEDETTSSTSRLQSDLPGFS